MQPAGRIIKPQFPWRIAALAVALVSVGSVAAEAPLSYNRDIRPILSNNCFMCHGPDKAQRKAGLRLDVEADALADRDGVRALVPGDPVSSALIQRILSTDPDEKMPPAGSGKELTPAQVALLQRWVVEGGKYEAHWAYIPPVNNGIPGVKATEWARNPVDNFVLAELEKRSLAPSPEADRVTQIRRLSFDLTGLPPTAEAVQAFLTDARPDAYEQLVDSLLASPQFGERMAVDWLDVVRYADTNGYHSDENRSMYPYRDYVIAAFNNNKPYDQFTREQIAGDLLPNATREQRIGAAYNRLNQITAEGGAQAKEYIEKYAADRVRTASTVWLGSTFACAQCHDHKYDPVSMRDFYSFAAFFADIEEQGVYGGGSKWDPVLDLPTEAQEKELARLEGVLAESQRILNTPTDDLAHAQRVWEGETLEKLKAERHVWATVPAQAARAQKGTQLTPQGDGAILASGPVPDQDVYELELNNSFINLTGLRLEVLPDDSLKQGLGRGNGNFILSGIEVFAGDQPVALASAVADFEQAGWPVAAALDADPATGWAVDGHTPERKNQPRQAVFRFAQPLPAGPDTHLRVLLRQESNVAKHNFGRFRLSLTTEATPQLDGVDIVPAEIKLLLLTSAEARTPDQVTALAAYFRSIAPALQPMREQLATATQQRDALKAQVAYVLATKSVAPRTVRVLPRGNWMDESGEVVEPATPEFLPAVMRSTPEKRLTRLDLANWLTTRDNPMTARVYMNRLWAMYYGAGISRVLDDVGIQGEWPTHPELLDWLAVEFMDSGWDIKHMARLMVTSSAYRQSSAPRHDLDETDPYNRLIACQGRFRLPAEFVRDGALRVAGLLSAKVGGPLAMPYQPDDYYKDCNTFRGPIIYDPSKGEEQYRRGLYTYWKRSFLHPSLLAFDAPSREECTATRTTSNTPLQALVLLNDPTYVEAARAFAERVLREGGAEPAARIAYAFRRAVGREATPREIPVLIALLEKHRQDFAADPAAAETFLNTGQHPVPADIPPAELAAWTSVARAILNLHETITRS